MLEIVHFDVCGLIETSSIRKKMILFLIFINDFTKIIWIYILRLRMHVFGDLRSLSHLLIKISLKLRYFMLKIEVKTYLRYLMLN